MKIQVQRHIDTVPAAIKIRDETNQTYQNP